MSDIIYLTADLHYTSEGPTSDAVFTMKNLPCIMITVSDFLATIAEKKYVIKARLCILTVTTPLTSEMGILYSNSLCTLLLLAGLGAVVAVPAIDDIHGMENIFAELYESLSTLRGIEKDALRHVDVIDAMHVACLRHSRLASFNTSDTQGFWRRFSIHGIDFTL